MVDPPSEDLLAQQTKDDLRRRIEAEMADLVPGYLENRSKDLQSLRVWAAKGDFESIRGVGHNMKGSGRGYGFEEVTEIGGALEGSAIAESGSEVAQHIDQLAAFLSRAQADCRTAHRQGEDRES